MKRFNVNRHTNKSFILKGREISVGEIYGKIECKKDDKNIDAYYIVRPYDIFQLEDGTYEIKEMYIYSYKIREWVNLVCDRIQGYYMDRNGVKMRCDCIIKMFPFKGSKGVYAQIEGFVSQTLKNHPQLLGDLKAQKISCVSDSCVLPREREVQRFSQRMKPDYYNDGRYNNGQSLLYKQGTIEAYWANKGRASVVACNMRYA